MGRSVQFLDVSVQGAAMSDVVARIDRWRDRHGSDGLHIAVVNSYCVALARERPDLRAIYEAADMVLPDGKPFVFWMRHVEGVPTEHISGTGLTRDLLQAGQELGWRFFFYGGHPEVTANLVSWVRRVAPDAQIAGAISPPFRALTTEEEKADLKKIRDAVADVVFVGLGTPKQDLWIARNQSDVGGAALIGVGATFDFFGGRVKRAPKIVTDAGLEWLWRMLGPDRARLFRRYSVYNFRFLRGFAAQSFRRGTRGLHGGS